MFNAYDQARIENAQRSTLHSLEGIRDSFKDMNQMVTPLRHLATAATVLKNQNHGVATCASGNLLGSASAGNRAAR